MRLVLVLLFVLGLSLLLIGRGVHGVSGETAAG
jgi:hypothetical protein